MPSCRVTGLALKATGYTPLGDSASTACGAVVGLRWADIDLKAMTLTVTQVRVLVGYEVRIEEQKSRNGKRALSFDDELVSALTELRKRQARTSDAAGTDYRTRLDDLDWYAQGNEYIVTDELRIPVHLEWYSDEFIRLLKRQAVQH